VCHNRRRSATQSVQEHRSTRQDLGRLVLWQQSCIWLSTTKASCKGFVLTPGNTDDRTPAVKLLQQLFGKVFADKGYVSQKLAKQLFKSVGVQLITKFKRNMKNRLIPLADRLLLRKRTIIESIIDQLKNISRS
jgi:hypothetical protein